MSLPPLPQVGSSLNEWGTALNAYLTALAAQSQVETSVMLFLGGIPVYFHRVGRLVECQVNPGITTTDPLDGMGGEDVPIGYRPMTSSNDFASAAIIPLSSDDGSPTGILAVLGGTFNTTGYGGTGFDQGTAVWLTDDDPAV